MLKRLNIPAGKVYNLCFLPTKKATEVAYYS